MAINRTPIEGLRVPPHRMREFVAALFGKAGMSIDDALLMSSVLVDTDLRGVFSHGTRMAPEYIERMLAGSVNPQPNIRFVRESDHVRVLDGDGGMGHLCCHRGAEWAVSEAAANGLAAVTTRNHNHFGAAGTYARMAIEHDCIGMAISSQHMRLDQNQSVRFAHIGSPFSIAIPALEQPPLVMDMAVAQPWNPKIFNRYPSIYLKNLALGSILQALGGILAGIYRPDFLPENSRREAHQGAFIAVFSIESFMPVKEFKTEMDRYIKSAQRMRPFPGFAKAELAGGPEANRVREYERSGIPIDSEHEQLLRHIASKLEIETPFDEYEQTRFGPGRGTDRRGWLATGKGLIREVRKRRHVRGRPQRD